MKKTIGKIFAVVLVFGMFTGCLDSSNIDNDQPRHAPTAAVVEKIKSELELRATKVVEENLVSEKYHLNMDDVEEQTIETGIVNTGIETIAVVKAKDGKVDSIKESFEKVKEDKKASAFYPGESEAVDAAEIKVIGDYVGFFIIPQYEEGTENNAQKAVDVFKKALR